ncbi:hypothetical protein [Streptomyces sp. VRA16 Mangrove soil]|uniref:hypothetical protein n=1 Tax=Streptomyces sp. VRA16 Mangrove soil TaxID=2817434 RepID=UPI001A9F7302|nr:hypothetical protein [Streptomyces sp. VRA16 Mangrove soil]MBO1333017.1 hypothetical protein [Streptomyces sp. VRA16 Mangrove soil]
MTAVSTDFWRGSRGRGLPVLELPCADRTVGVAAALELPSVMMLVVEDACTRIAYADWRHREPSRLHVRARRRWQAEGHQLRAKRQRLRELAVECLDAPD